MLPTNRIDIYQICAALRGSYPHSTCRDIPSHSHILPSITVNNFQYEDPGSSPDPVGCCMPRSAADGLHQRDGHVRRLRGCDQPHSLLQPVWLQRCTNSKLHRWQERRRQEEKGKTKSFLPQPSCADSIATQACKCCSCIGTRMCTWANQQRYCS